MKYRGGTDMALNFTFLFDAGEEGGAVGSEAEEGQARLTDEL